jgi:hypothetical protein
MARMGPFIDNEGVVECSVCAKPCVENTNFRQRFERDVLYDARWQMFFRCNSCKRDYIIIAYEAILEVA